MSQRVSSNTNGHQPKLIDKSIKGVLSGGNGSNLINLTQSAAARQGREAHIITGPSPDINTSSDFYAHKANAWTKNGGSTTKNSRLLNRATSASVRTGIQNTNTNLQVRKNLTNNNFIGASKPELVIEGTTATESTNHNSGGSQNKTNEGFPKPPRDSINKHNQRPQTSGSSSAATFNFYNKHSERRDQNSSGVVSLSVDRTSIKYSRSSAHNQSQSSSNNMPSGQGSLDNYQIGKPVGQGAYAVVYVCYHKASMKKFAIKIYQKAKLNDSMKRKAV